MKQNKIKPTRNHIAVFVVIIFALIAFLKANQQEVENGQFPSTEEVKEQNQQDEMIYYQYSQGRNMKLIEDILGE